MGHGLKKLAGQTVIYGLTNIVGRFVNYLLVPLYTYLFVPEEYGIVAELYAYVAFFNIILTYGMETAYFRFANKEEEEKVYAVALFSLTGSSVFFILLVVLLRGYLASFLGSGAAVPYEKYLLWFSFILAIDAVTALPLARMRQHNKAWRFAGVKMINILSNVFFNLLFILWLPKWAENNPSHFLAQLYNPSLGVGYIFLSNLLASFILLLMVLPDILSMQISFSPSLWKKMIRYGGPLALMGLAGIVNETIDRPMIKYLASGGLQDRMHQVGVYAACYKIAILITILIQAYRYAAEPFFFQKEKEKGHRETYAQIMEFFIKIMLLITLFIVANLAWIGYFVGDQYREGLSIVPVLLIANVFLGVYYNLSVWYKLTDRTWFGTYLALLGALITLAGNFILIPLMGYSGAALTTLLCYGIMTVVSYALSRRYYPIPYSLRIIGKDFLIFFILFLLTRKEGYVYEVSIASLVWHNLPVAGFFLWILISSKWKNSNLGHFKTRIE